MPTYEYECKSCGHRFDAFQNIKDEPLKVCPECGKELRRLIYGGTGVIFKGGGFYVTDKGGKTVTGGKTGEKTEAAPAKEGVSKTVESPAKPEPATGVGTSAKAGAKADAKATGE